MKFTNLELGSLRAPLGKLIMTSSGALISARPSVLDVFRSSTIKIFFCKRKYIVMSDVVHSDTRTFPPPPRTGGVKSAPWGDRAENVQHWYLQIKLFCVPFNSFVQGIVSMNLPILVYVAGVQGRSRKAKKRKKGKDEGTSSLPQSLLLSLLSLFLSRSPVLRLLLRLTNLVRLHKLLDRSGAKFLPHELAHVLTNTCERCLHVLLRVCRSRAWCHKMSTSS